MSRLFPEQEGYALAGPYIEGVIQLRRGSPDGPDCRHRLYRDDCADQAAAGWQRSVLWPSDHPIPAR